jgi:hypothetical protein
MKVTVRVPQDSLPFKENNQPVNFDSVYSRLSISERQKIDVGKDGGLKVLKCAYEGRPIIDIGFPRLEPVFSSSTNPEDVVASIRASIEALSTAAAIVQKWIENCITKRTAGVFLTGKNREPIDRHCWENLLIKPAALLIELGGPDLSEKIEQVKMAHTLDWRDQRKAWYVSHINFRGELDTDALDLEPKQMRVGQILIHRYEECIEELLELGDEVLAEFVLKSKIRLAGEFASATKGRKDQNYLHQFFNDVLRHSECLR